jgi:carboxypeptidase family protein
VLAVKSVRLTLVIATILSVASASATTCIANREFKLRQVCGVVTDKSGASISKVNVKLLDANSAVISNAETNANGEFVITNVRDGNYILRVKFDGFATAWQRFRVHHSKRDKMCGRPIRVRLELAGHCSVVSDR